MYDIAAALFRVVTQPEGCSRITGTDSFRALGLSPPGEPSHSQIPSEAMRASGDLVEIVACLSRNDQCVNRFEVSRVLFRPQVFGGMELGMGRCGPNRAVSDLPWGRTYDS